jgi:hypothetical protein
MATTSWFDRILERKALTDSILSYERTDAWQVVVTLPNAGVTIAGIAVPLTPAPDRWMVYVSEDWIPALFWRKHWRSIDPLDDEWIRFKCHKQHMRFVARVWFRFNDMKFYQYSVPDTDNFDRGLFPSIQYHYRLDMDTGWHSIRAWTLRGWYVQDNALPIGIDASLDHAPALFRYEDCTPLPGAKAAERMKTFLPLWQPDFEAQGAFLKQYGVARDDAEIAASTFVEEYAYLDSKDNPIQPTQKATKWLYTVFCAAAGYLVED